MADCRFCGKGGLVERPGKHGGTYLYELRPHVATCTAYQAKRKAQAASPRAIVRAYLVGQYGVAEAERLLRGCKARDEEGLMREALARRKV